jgi:hypothetical protein
MSRSEVTRWARLHVSFVGGPNRKHTIIHVLGVGYEDAANTAIAAGSCTGAEQSGAATSSQSSRGSSLGMLALGSAAAAER